MLHLTLRPGPIEIEWEVEIRVRDYGATPPSTRPWSVDELTPDELAAVAACAPEALIDLAARQGIIDDKEEARQLALLGADAWSPDQLGEFTVVHSLCETLKPGP